MDNPLNLTASKYTSKGAIYFALSLLIFGLISFGEISIAQLPLVYIPLLCLFLFNRTTKLTIDPDWLVYAGLAAAVVFIAAISAKYPDHAMMEAAKYRDVALLGFSLYLSLRHDLVEWSNAIFAGIACAFLAVAVVTLWEFLSAIPDLQGDHTHINPDLSYYGHIRHFSYHAFAASLLASICVFQGNQKNVFAWLVLAGCLIALLVSGGRGAIAGYGLFLLIYGVVRLDRRVLLRFALIAIALVVGAVVLLALSPASALVESLLARSDLSQGLDSVFSGRIYLWTLSWNASFEYPLFGYGPGGFQQIPGTPTYASQPHSFPLQLVIEFGWLGGAVIALCLIRLLLKVFMPRGGSIDAADVELALVLKCAVIAYLVFSLVDGLFYHPIPLIHFAVIFAALTACNRRCYAPESDAMEATG
ncbi:MAG: O-antigen ligase family protein [Arenicella sp.]|nr:O-antigen ligase family protein [Arenicella sp.]